jgi:hypothetical protein
MQLDTGLFNIRASPSSSTFSGPGSCQPPAPPNWPIPHHGIRRHPWLPQARGGVIRHDDSVRDLSPIFRGTTGRNK